jgi:hypothetical protein
LGQKKIAVFWYEIWHISVTGLWARWRVYKSIRIGRGEAREEEWVDHTADLNGPQNIEEAEKLIPSIDSGKSTLH